ncbi:MAG: hypothetical protein JWM68_2909 [Verrucomicrobiales bacterium]|nr:hypothetical protein [Verrucomicrobiales bacterium]
MGGKAWFGVPPLGGEALDFRHVCKSLHGPLLGGFTG